jgi:hypothetical protein
MAQWVGPIAVGTPDEQSFDFAVAALGQRAVVVRRVQSVADTMRVSLFDADLGLVAAGVDTPPPGFGPSSVLGSPSGDSVLVAWTATNPNAYRVHATRFDCVL